MNFISALVLAAGYSSRLGRFKPLAPLGETTILERVVKLFQASGILDVRVVVGHRKDDLIPLVAKLKAYAVINPDYDQGMFSSVKAGVAGLGAETRAFFVMPVDIPLVRPWTIRRLCAEAREKPGRIIYPNFRGRRGHPPLIPMDLAAAIQAWPGQGGLKALLREHESRAVHLEVPDEHILFDLDRPEDLEPLAERWRRYGLPTPEEQSAILAMTCGLQGPVFEHCQATAALAVRLGEVLQLSGGSLDLDLVRAAAMLHDLAKGSADHAAAGAKLLGEMGFSQVAEIVASHSNLPASTGEQISEAELVYLVDKLLDGHRLISLEDRFMRAMKKYAHRLDLRPIIALRYEHAYNTKRLFERLTGRPLEDFLAGRPDPEKSPQRPLNARQ